VWNIEFSIFLQFSVLFIKVMLHNIIIHIYYVILCLINCLIFKITNIDLEKLMIHWVYHYFFHFGYTVLGKIKFIKLQRVFFLRGL